MEPHPKDPAPNQASSRQLFSFCPKLGSNLYLVPPLLPSASSVSWGCVCIGGRELSLLFPNAITLRDGLDLTTPHFFGAFPKLSLTTAPPILQ